MAEATVTAWLLEAHKSYRDIKEFLETFDKNQNTELKDKAEETLLKMEKEIADFKPEDSELKFQLRLISALVKYQLGTLFIKSAERAEAYFKDAWEIVKEHSLRSDYAYLSLCILVELTGVLTVQNKIEDAKEYSMQNTRLCKQFGFTAKPCTKSFEDLFLSKSERRKNEPSDFLNDFSYMIETMGKSYIDSIQSKWLKIVSEFLEKNPETFEWVNELIKFSYDLILGESFRLARRVLSCASQLSLECENALKVLVKDENDARWEQLKCANIVISQTWGSYAMCLMASSVGQRLLRETEARSSRVDETLPDVFNNLGYLSKENVERHENKIICTFVNDYEEAKKVFVFGLSSFHSVSIYYASDKVNDNHIIATLNVCKLYEYLRAYENDNDRKCKMFKRSTKLLEEELKTPNARFFPKFQQQMALHLADCYFRSACIKYGQAECMERAESVDVSSLKRLKEKVNNLAGEATENYKLFLSHFTTDKLPNTLPLDVVERVLGAHAKMADTYLIHYVEATLKIDQYRQARELYTDLLKYIESNPDHEMFIVNKLPLVRKTLEMLPWRIQLIVDQHMNSMSQIQ